MDAITQSLYGLDLAPYLFGTLTYVVVFALLMRRRARIIHPRHLWILPAFAWIIAVSAMAMALPQTGTQVIGVVVLMITAFGIGVLLCLSDSLKHDPVADSFTQTTSLLSIGAASLIVALLIGSGFTHFWPQAVFIAGLFTGQSVCLWRWSEYLRKPPEVFHNGI